MNQNDLDVVRCPTCGARVPSIFDHLDLNCEEVDRLDGMFAGQYDPDDYEPLIEAGLLRKSYEGGPGFMGLAKLRKVAIK